MLQKRDAMTGIFLVFLPYFEKSSVGFVKKNITLKLPVNCTNN